MESAVANPSNTDGVLLAWSPDNARRIAVALFFLPAVGLGVGASLALLFGEPRWLATMVLTLPLDVLMLIVMSRTMPGRVELRQDGIEWEGVFGISGRHIPWSSVVSVSPWPPNQVAIHVRNGVETWGTDGDFVTLEFPPELGTTVEALIREHMKGS